MDPGQLFACWSAASFIKGTDDLKPGSFPAVVHLRRPP